jgi:hypothetical protein
MTAEDHLLLHLAQMEKREQMMTLSLIVGMMETLTLLMTRPTLLDQMEYSELTMMSWSEEEN